ncbi:hypothetical protein [Alicyclobacillus macrosporangiidus]|uniref:Uncharacterized protein n=1 Tax=Alicyclobacillus macrosporangiidus TaxID=392015 RepID=A0A1I7L1Y8_9BACL|nr:hypothetical protein [Alicyclobacillus macrosporangiidus]SFV03638.1 hypothetical protein SAMN05421543_12312 [Alicyclobacillus macrosporangiidus]
MLTTYKPWITKVPESLRRDIRLASATKERRIRDVIESALNHYFASVDEGGMPAVDQESLDRYAEERWVDWGIQLSRDVYIQLKTLSLQTGNRIYDLFVTAMVRYLRDIAVGS